MIWVKQKAQFVILLRFYFRSEQRTMNCKWVFSSYKKEILCCTQLILLVFIHIRIWKTPRQRNYPTLYFYQGDSSFNQYFFELCQYVQTKLNLYLYLFALIGRLGKWCVHLALFVQNILINELPGHTKKIYQSIGHPNSIFTFLLRK